MARHFILKSHQREESQLAGAYVACCYSFSKADVSHESPAAKLGGWAATSPKCSLCFCDISFGDKTKYLLKALFFFPTVKLLK